MRAHCPSQALAPTKHSGSKPGSQHPITRKGGSRRRPALMCISTASIPKSHAAALPIACGCVGHRMRLLQKKGEKGEMPDALPREEAGTLATKEARATRRTRNAMRLPADAATPIGHILMRGCVGASVAGAPSCIRHCLQSHALAEHDAQGPGARAFHARPCKCSLTAEWVQRASGTRSRSLG